MQQQQQQQQQNTIKNPTQDQPQSPQMNDRDMINDCLATCKYVTDGLNVMAREASHRQLYDDVKNMLVETHQAIRDTFNLMFEKGYYELEPAQQQKVQQAGQQFSSYAQSQFPGVGQKIMQ